MAEAVGNWPVEPGGQGEEKEDVFMECFVPERDDDNLQEQKDEISALQSFYEGSDFERLKVLSSPNEEGKGLFFIHLTIPLQEQSKPVSLDIMLPTYEEQTCNATREVTPVLPGVNLQRSDSGQRWVGSLSIDYLSPLTLQISLPVTYPSHNPPVFTISSAWLSSTHLGALCRKLDELWNENGNMAIIFTWIDWLENNILSFLGLEDSVIIKPFNETETRDPRALPESTDLGHNIISVLQHNRLQTEYEFCRNDQDCGVCFDRLPGNHFYRIGNCGHHYCATCMTEYCEMHVSAGTVESLKCPDSKCDEIIPPYIVQSVLPPGAYDRWERLVLQKSLTFMEDVVWCPRCSEPVIKEAEETLNLAHCISCFYSFCTECNETWHQGKECETAEGKLEQLQNKKQPENEAERKRFEELRRKIVEDIENQKMMKEKIKKCPKCKVRIEKIAGCNKMTCRCGQAFCWLCQKAITGYTHFTGGFCPLLAAQLGPVYRVVQRQRADGNLWIQANLELNPDARQRICVCPCCRQNNLKARTNNHIKCWNCKTNFCFQCKSRLTGVITQHFTSATPCKQHS